MTGYEKPLHLRQSEGLHALAEFVKAHPVIAPYLRHTLGMLLAPVTKARPRAELGRIVTAAMIAGVPFMIDNEPLRCVVTLSFGDAVRVEASVPALGMAGQTPGYQPLTVPGGES